MRRAVFVTRWWRAPFVVLYAVGAIVAPAPFVFTGAGWVTRALFAVGAVAATASFVAHRRITHAFCYAVMVAVSMYRAFTLALAPGVLATANRTVGALVYVTLASCILCLGALTDE